MSYCRREGKDTILFATKEDHQQPSSVNISPPEPGPGLIMPDGSINWNCPCLGGMATGPCGIEFRDAFTCFHYSPAEPKGSDCFSAFQTMQDCMAKYPTVYNRGDDEEGEFPMVDSDTNTNSEGDNKSIEGNKNDSVVDKKK
uniref:CHCH domain-containing protein n=1 Tax=Graphocephala atropunctata TaxID=36148 RepID=A0A1B6LWA8_9HEMI